MSLFFDVKQLKPVVTKKTVITMYWRDFVLDSSLWRFRFHSLCL